MRRGTRVGEAYVALTADGTGLNEDIVDEVESAGPGIDDAGKKHGEGYGENFGDSTEDTLGPIMDRLGEEMGKRLSKQVGNSLRSSFSSSAQNSIVGRLGDALNDRIEETVAGVEDRIADVIKQSGGGSSGGGGGGRGAGPGSPSFPSQGPDPDRDQAVWDMAQRMNERFDRERTILLARASAADEAFDRSRTIMLDRAHALNEKFDRAQGLFLDRAYAENDAFDRRRTIMLDRAYAMNERVDQQREDNIRREGLLLERAYEMNDRFDRDRGRMIARALADNDRFDRARTKMLSEAYRLNAQFDAGKLGGDGRSNGVSGNSKDMDFGSSIGKLLGAGSRNNFLNLIGKTIGNTVGLVTKAGKAASEMFDVFQGGFKAANAGFLGLGKVAGGFGAVAARIGPAFAAAAPAAIVAIGAIGFALSALVSVVSALLALVVALAAALTTALTGAAIIAAGALGAVVVAGGLLVAAFTSMTDAQKALLSEDFQPLKAQITGLGQTIIEDLLPYLSQIAPLLSRALGLLGPVANQIGDAFGQAGLSIATALSGPGFVMLSQTLAVYLPQIIANLGRAFGALLNGLAATFSAILPYVTRFSSYLADVATRFSTFASSAQGQNSIVDFMDRAVVSIKSVFGFLRELSGLIFDVLFSSDAQTAGNSLFDSLANSFAGFRENVQRAIADGSFKKWFDDAIKFGGDLKDAIIAIKDAFVALNDSGVLALVGEAIKGLAGLVSDLAAGIDKLKDGINTIASIQIPDNPLAIGKYGINGTTLSDKVSGNSGSDDDDGGIFDPNYQVPPAVKDKFNAIKGLPPTGQLQGPTIAESQAAAAAQAVADSMVKTGQTALANTSVDSGGYGPSKIKPEYVNPYVKFAEKLIKEGPALSATIKNAIIKVNGEIAAALTDASVAKTVDAARASLNDTMDSIRENAKTSVNTAQSALNSAAQSLASATSASAAKKALKQVQQAQKDVAAAQANQKKINAVAKTLANQRVVTESSVQNILKGIKSENYTLAEYAEARSRLAVSLEAANRQLADAVALRDSYNTAVVDSVKSFGSLMTAQAKTINGVQQALTATDITQNLSDRLAKIRKFQENLQILLAQGLSNDAYKQIVDAGVEAGGATAEALIAGGQGAVAGVNGLVDQIAGVADSLGMEASNRLYKAGVDAAQGLVDGLNSLSAQLDSAAAALGNAIAAAVKRSLGIASPSKVLRNTMGYVGDGIVLGLDDQKADVERAANRLAGTINVAPSTEVARYTAAQSRAGVSGNPLADGTEHHWHIETPTTDPKAVANEAINEITARIS